MFYRDIVEAKQHVENLESDYLRRWGWKETCNTPGSYWLWGRDFADYDAKFDEWNRKHPDKAHKPTGSMLLPKDMALSVTLSCLDERQEDGGDED